MFIYLADVAVVCFADSASSSTMPLHLGLTQKAWKLDVMAGSDMSAFLCMEEDNATHYKQAILCI